MPESLQPVLRYLHQVVGPENALTEQGDAHLLGQYLDQGDERAFAEVVRRHGPMVWAICLHLLDEKDAEDSFQATFLVLLRKARSLRRPEQLGPWLHGVACRTARKARCLRGRRQQRECSLPDDTPGRDAIPAVVLKDLRRVLDEELDRLPDRFRVPFLLCAVQGLSHEEAARRLGCARGTIDSRMARARERLRQRLTRRGVMLSEASVLALLVGDYRVPVPPALLESVARAGGPSPLRPTPAVLALSEGVIFSMFLQKCKLVAVTVLLLGVLSTGVGLLLPGNKGTLAGPTPAQGEPPAASASAPAPKPPPAKPRQGAEARPWPKDREQLRETLHSVVDFQGVDDPKTTLGEILDSLARQYEVAYDINERAFTEDEVGDVLKCELANPNRIPALRTSLATVLNKILARVPSPSGATYLIRKDLIEITTSKAVRAELGLEGEGPLPPLVVEKFENMPLPEALDTIADSCDTNVVLDPRAEGADEVRVRARLYNVPVETAIQILADMADLAVVHLHNVYYVTTPENAKKQQDSGS